MSYARVRGENIYRAAFLQPYSCLSARESLLFTKTRSPHEIAMSSSIKNLALLALATGLASVTGAQSSGSGTTTRYWDCCKGSCSWPDKADVSSPVAICDKNDSPISDFNTASACDGGDAHMCSDQSPWVVNDNLAYGFAAVSAGGSQSDTCCSCFE